MSDVKKKRRKPRVPPELREGGTDIGALTKKIGVAQFGPAAAHPLAWAMVEIRAMQLWLKARGFDDTPGTPSDAADASLRRSARQRALDGSRGKSMCLFLAAECARMIEDGDSAGLLGLATAFHSIVANPGGAVDPLREGALRWWAAAWAKLNREPEIREVLTCGVECGEISETKAKTESFTKQITLVLKDLNFPLRRGIGGRPRKGGRSQKQTGG